MLLMFSFASVRMTRFLFDQAIRGEMNLLDERIGQCLFLSRRDDFLSVRLLLCRNSLPDFVFREPSLRGTNIVFAEFVPAVVPSRSTSSC